MKATLQPSTYALVIGITDYRDAEAAQGARRDAERFAIMAQRTMGVPRKNVRVALGDRATRGDLEKHLRWLKDNVGPRDRVMFFFSGHGAPGIEDKGAYLIDAHNNQVAEPVWSLFDELTHQIPDVPALIEWDNQIPSLEILQREATRAEQIRGRAAADQAATSVRFSNASQRQLAEIP